MHSFPIHDDVEETIESALEHGVTDVSHITGRIVRFHTDPPSPEEVRELIESKQDGAKQSKTEGSDVQDGSISDEELRRALESAGIDGENAGEIPS